LLYVSILERYKHHQEVIEATAQLRGRGLAVTLDLVGPEGPATHAVRASIARFDPASEFIRYQGAVSYDLLHAMYARADVSIFASSCETFGQILTEAMAAGLPIACSNQSAMPEVLGDAGLFFDPSRPEEITAAVSRLMESAELRAQKAEAAFTRARAYSWERCANETFAYLARVVGT
jgi:glycosyltransferase involved in cell wall biosynthesis